MSNVEGKPYSEPHCHGPASKTFYSACFEYFGYRTGQHLQDFAVELKALTPKDRDDLAPMLESALHVSISPPQFR